ncbi:MAG: RsmB/NOP family class I SAM-dependent RNA methyltransferase [Deltaproteobacteria bacterium]|nr:RsmB/NOP family class I SAM-dependent RNA methyltransferase [Deltaproteobacteria bacterium]
MTKSAPADEDLAWTVAERAARGGAYAAKLLADTFHRRRDLDAARKKHIAEISYGLLRRARTLELAADLAGAPNRRRVMLAMRARLDDPALAPDAWSELEPALAELSPSLRVAVEGSFPEWLAERLIDDFGREEASRLARALSSAPPTDVRANRDRDALIAALEGEGVGADPLPRTRLGARLRDEPRDLFATRAFREGAFELQDEGSQLVAELVAPNPGALVVDACAGEGGKTLAIAAQLGGRGRIIACDVAPQKLEALKRRAARAGVTNVQTVAIDREGPLPSSLANLASRADRVLVDAPCSGVGTFRRNPEARQRLDRAATSRLAREQRAIGARFAPLVAPGGRLIYATCTVLREEDEASAEAIARDAGFVVMRVAEIWGNARAADVADPSGTYLRLFPHVHGTDGFFGAVLRRPRVSRQSSVISHAKSSRPTTETDG